MGVSNVRISEDTLIAWGVLGLLVFLRRRGLIKGLLRERGYKLITLYLTLILALVKVIDLA